MIKLTKKRTEGICPATRCKAAANGLWVEHRTDPDDPTIVEVVSFCDRHCELSGGVEVDAPTEAPEPVVEPPQEAPPAHISAELNKEAAELSDALELIRDFEVVDQDDVDFAKEALAEAKAQYKELETKRKKATGPLRESIKEIDGWFKPAKDALAEIERLWKGKLKDARKAFEARQAALLQEARDAEDSEQACEALMAASDAEIDSSGIQYRDNWVYEVVDIAAIPREYWTIDHKLLAGDVKRLKNKTDIPGVRAWNDPIIAVRSR